MHMFSRLVNNPIWNPCQIFSRFFIFGDHKKWLDKILKILETQSELIHMLTCYKLLLILELIPICNVISGEWPSCYPEPYWKTQVPIRMTDLQIGAVFIQLLKDNYWQF